MALPIQIAIKLCRYQSKFYGIVKTTADLCHKSFGKY